MKKLYYLLAGIAMILVTIVACEKASIGVDEMQTLQKQDVAAKSNDKVTICHYDTDLEESYQITISIAGLNGHEDHVNDVIPDYADGHYIPLDDSDNDGIIDCADCNPNNSTPHVSLKKTWYKDADGDGFGDSGVYIKTCEIREGYVSNFTDCDDTDPAINPGATEVCDGVDNNCDGNIDEGVKTTFYQDLDGDTFGNPDESVEACEAPDGYVLDNTDCDDTDANFYPKVGLGLGSYVFSYATKYVHDYTMTSFDGVNFVGSGGYPAIGSTDTLNLPLLPDSDYAILEEITGIVIDGVLNGTVTYIAGRTGSWTIKGTVDDCGRITSLGLPWSL